MKKLLRSFRPVFALFLFCTTPLLAVDTDGDGVPDSVEVKERTNPLDATSFNSFSTGLAAYYPLESDTLDYVNGNTGSSFNLQFLQENIGSSSSAAYFDGTAGIIIAESPSLQLGPNHTLSLWIKVSTWGAMGGNTGYDVFCFGDASSWPSNPHQAALSTGINPNTADYSLDSIDSYPTRILTSSRASNTIGNGQDLGWNRTLGLNSGDWALLTWSHDGQNIKTYLNGDILHENESFHNGTNLSPYIGGVLPKN